MIALLDDIAVFHKQYVVRVPYRGQSVRDDETRASAHQPGHGLAYLRLGTRIDAGRRLVEYEYGRVAQEYARYRNELPLPYGQVASVVGQHRIVHLRHRPDEVVHLCRLRRCDDFFARSVRLAVGYVFGYRAAEQPGILQNHTEVMPQALARKRRGRYAVYGYSSAVNFVEAHEQVYERGFAGAGGADHSYLLSGLRREAYVLHQNFIGEVSETDVLERYASLRSFQRDRIVGVRLFLLVVEEFERTLRGRKRRLQGIDHIRHLRERLGREIDVLEERLRHAGRHGTGYHPAAGQEEYDGLRQAGQKADERVYTVGKEVRFLRCRAHILRAGRNAGAAFAFAVIRLYDVSARVILLRNAGQPGDGFLPLRSADQVLLRHDSCYDQADGGEGEEYEREYIIEYEHEYERTYDRTYGRQKFEQTGLQRFGHLVEVARHAAENLARFVQVKEFQRQFVQLDADLSAQRKDQSFGDARHQKRLQVIYDAERGVHGAQNRHFPAERFPYDRKRSVAAYRVVNRAEERVHDDGAVIRREYVQHRIYHDADGDGYQSAALVFQLTEQSCRGSARKLRRVAGNHAFFFKPFHCASASFV